MQKCPSNAISKVSVTRASRMLAVLALAAGLLATGASGPGNAETIAFDHTGTVTTTVNVTGVTGGTMLFSLSVGGPLDLSGSNNFSLDVLNAASDAISSMNFLGLDQFAGSHDYGDATAPANSPRFEFEFFDLMTWSVAVAAGDLSPLALNIFSVLTPDSGPLSPLLTVEFTGDLQLAEVAAVPLPGSLPLFVTGIAVLAVLRWRREYS